MAKTRGGKKKVHVPAHTRTVRTKCSPASTLLGVARLASPELLVEIEATAVI